MRIFLLPLLALVGIVGIGCQNSTAPASHAMASPDRAVVVSGGNGGSTTVFLMSDDPSNPVVLCTSGDPVCPECKAAAIKYFKTGILDAKCSRTGATRSVATGVPPNYGHN